MDMNYRILTIVWCSNHEKEEKLHMTSKQGKRIITVIVRTYNMQTVIHSQGQA